MNTKLIAQFLGEVAVNLKNSQDLIDAVDKWIGNEANKNQESWFPKNYLNNLLKLIKKYNIIFKPIKTKLYRQIIFNKHELKKYLPTFENGKSIYISTIPRSFSKNQKFDDFPIKSNRKIVNLEQILQLEDLNIIISVFPKQNEIVVDFTQFSFYDFMDEEEVLLKLNTDSKVNIEIIWGWIPPSDIALIWKP